MDVLMRTDGQKLIPIKPITKLISGSQLFVRFIFNLSDDWKNLTTFAQFEQNGTPYDVYLDAENSAYLPPEIKDGKCSITLRGTGGSVKTSSSTVVMTVDLDRISQEGIDSQITQTIYDQLTNKITDLVVTSDNNLERLMNEVRPADNVAFNQYVTTGASSEAKDKVPNNEQVKIIYDNLDTKKAEKHFLTILDNKIMDGDVQCQFNTLKTLLTNKKDIIILMYGNKAYNASVIRDDKIVFCATYEDNGTQKIGCVTVTSDDAVSYTDNVVEVKANKSNTLNDSAEKYPSNKAVKDYVDGISTTLTGNISTLQTSVNTTNTNLTERIGTAETSISTATSDISDIKTGIEGINGDIEVLQNDVPSIKKDYYKSSDFKGLKVSVLGDSFSAYTGHVVPGMSIKYTGSNLGVSSVDQMWWKIVCDELEMTPFQIDAWSGTSVAKIDSVDEKSSGYHDNRVYHLARVTTSTSGGETSYTIEEKPDVIYIALGGNDFLKNVPLGEWGLNGHTRQEYELPTDPTTFTNAYAIMLNKIVKTFPDSAIIAITPWYVSRGYDLHDTFFLNKQYATMSDYGNIVKNLCQMYGVNVIDSHMFGFNRYNYYPTFSSEVESPISSGKQTNSTHPNALGHSVIGHTVADQTRLMLSGFAMAKQSLKN